MAERPELIAFGQNKLGGLQSYYFNLLSNDPFNRFDKRWILTDYVSDRDAKLMQPYNYCEEIFFSYGEEPVVEVSKKLNDLISDRPGIVLTNFEVELNSLYYFRKKNKTIFFICHDQLYLVQAIKYEVIIDVYIAHNYYFFEELKRKLPKKRTNDIYYLPYGITPSPWVRNENLNRSLKVLFLARLSKTKGIFDLPKIEDELLTRNIKVTWTIIGDGPDKNELVASLKSYPNFTFYNPATTEEVFKIASAHDIFVLPSYLDGMPVALLEAMSAGLVPIISRFNEGINAVVTPKNGFIVPVGDSKGFADKIEWLHNHRNEMEQMSTHAHATIVNGYEVKKRAMDYYLLFDKYRSLKKPIRKGSLKYANRLDRPYIPKFVRDGLRWVKRVIENRTAK